MSTTGRPERGGSSRPRWPGLGASPGGGASVPAPGRSTAPLHLETLACTSPIPVQLTGYTSEYSASRVMSIRLLRPENRLTLENLLTPVRKLKRMCASENFTVEYRLRRKSRLARATSGASSLSRIGLSYSSTRTATRWPARSWSSLTKCRKRRDGSLSRGVTSASSSMTLNCAATSVRTSSGAWYLPLLKSRRTTGWRADQSQCSWMCSPSKSGSLPSNSSLQVSRNRLLPKRRGRDRK